MYNSVFLNTLFSIILISAAIYFIFKYSILLTIVATLSTLLTLYILIKYRRFAKQPQQSNSIN